MHPDRTQQSLISWEDGFLPFLFPLIWSSTCTCCFRGQNVTTTCFPVRNSLHCITWPGLCWSSSVHSHVLSRPPIFSQLSRFLQDQHQSLKEIPFISSLVIDSFIYSCQFSLFMTPNYSLAWLTKNLYIMHSFSPHNSIFRTLSWGNRVVFK